MGWTDWCGGGAGDGALNPGAGCVAVDLVLHVIGGLCGAAVARRAWQDLVYPMAQLDRGDRWCQVQIDRRSPICVIV